MRGESPEGLPREDRATAARGLRRGLGVLALTGRGPAGRGRWVPGPAGAAEGRQAGAARPRASSRPPPGGQLGVSSWEGPRLPLPGSSNFWKSPPLAPDVPAPGVPGSLRAGCGEASAARALGFRSLPWKARARPRERRPWGRWERGPGAGPAWIRALPHPPVSKTPTKPEPPCRRCRPPPLRPSVRSQAARKG